jgi:hypothetical protein
MQRARTLFITAAAVVVSAGLSSCGAYRVVVPTDPRLTDSSTSAKPTSVAGYTTTDGRYHSFHGYLTLTADSLVLTPRVPVMKGGAGSPPRAIALSRNEVLSLTLDEGVSISRSVFSAVGLLVIGVAIGLAVWVAGGSRIEF